MDKIWDESADDRWDNGYDMTNEDIHDASAEIHSLHFKELCGKIAKYFDKKPCYHITKKYFL